MYIYIYIYIHTYIHTYICTYIIQIRSYNTYASLCRLIYINGSFIHYIKAFYKLKIRIYVCV